MRRTPSFDIRRARRRVSRPLQPQAPVGPHSVFFRPSRVHFSRPLCLWSAGVLAPSRAGDSFRIDPRRKPLGGPVDYQRAGSARGFAQRRFTLHGGLQLRPHHGSISRRGVGSVDRHRWLLCAFAVSLIISGLGMMLIRSDQQRAINSEQNFLREFKEGFQYVWASPVILSSIMAAYTFAVFIVTYQGFLPVFAKEVLEVGPDGLGLLMAAPGIGGIASLTFLASAGERWNRAKLLWLTTTVTPIFLILFCASPDFWLSVVLLTVVGAGQVSFRTISRVIIQIEAPRDLLGRAMSVFNMDQGMRSLGSIVMGAFATIFGASLGIALTAAVSLIITTALFYRLLGKRV